MLFFSGIKIVIRSVRLRMPRAIFKHDFVSKNETKQLELS